MNHNNNFKYEGILRCPVQKSKLKRQEQHYYSEQGTSYGQINGIINLLPKNAAKFREIEEKFWDYTFNQERGRSLENRNTDFHTHFKKPLVDLPKESLILEVACGSRLDTLEIAQSGKYIIATDISRQALELARQLAKKAGVTDKIMFIQATAEYLPFADDCFDGVLISAAFHHLENPEIGLQEMRRVVKNNGYIILGVEPNSWPYKTIYPLLAPLKKYIRQKRQRGIDSIADDSTQGFNKKQLENILKKHDLEIIDIKPVKYISEFYDSYLRLKERLTKKPADPYLIIQRTLSNFDNFLSHVPLINKFSWHWNVISKVRK